MAKARTLIYNGPPGAERIIVDLSGLQFIDSIGMAALGRIETHYATERFGLIRAPEQVQRAIALTGLKRALPFLG
jgi:anti-anti-sigma factor